jgi:hypothetical protein
MPIDFLSILCFGLESVQPLPKFQRWALVVGQRLGLSKGDIENLNRLFPPSLDVYLQVGINFCMFPGDRQGSFRLFCGQRHQWMVALPREDGITLKPVLQYHVW